MEKYITIKGAKENNLKNINVRLPRDKFIVFTGLSGSGKSSLAFDTIYAEGQRRYVESLSSYARMFLGQMDKPDVESIDGLSPAISIDQKTTSKNPRSTVGTVTEIYDYLRLMYARIGRPHCPVCGREISMQTVDQIVDQILSLPEGTKINVLAPVIRKRKGEHKKLLEEAERNGYVRVRVDGDIYDLSEEITLEKNIKHDIEIVIDRLVVRPSIRSRLSDSIETALHNAKGIVIVNVIDKEDLVFSQNYACPEHGTTISELTPRMFSFNNPFGACPKCDGIGHMMRIDETAVVSDERLSLNEGAIKASGWHSGYGDSIANMYLHSLARTYDFSLDTPYKDLPKSVKDVILYGTGDREIEIGKLYSSHKRYGPFEGVITNLERRYHETNSEFMRQMIETIMVETDCKLCGGTRLKKEVLSVTVAGLNIHEMCSMPVSKLLPFIEKIKLTEREETIAHQILIEIRNRLKFLNSVGLSYLTLSRSAGTLSGGESQRIRLATQIGSALVGVLYILDEPSIGLHQRDNDKLLATLKQLRDQGNTVIVVEHDEDTIRAADHVLDIGPGAGIHGGDVVVQGTPEQVMACKSSITGQYLSKAKYIPIPETRRKGRDEFLEVIGATENNLKGIDVSIPLGTFTCVTGVSGSGKSSLVNNVLSKVLSGELNRAKTVAGHYKEIKGLEYLDKVITIDQSPIGRTPRSNPATYTSVFSDIRTLFASTQSAKARGYGPGRFSFNVRGGRCEACQGDGIIKIEMHFLPDIYVPCEVCKGARYSQETLEVRYKGKSISDVLEMTVEEGMHFFESIPRIYRKLKTLYDVGLSYIKIGQSSTTLSGGEAQRVKLATELSKRPTGRTIYILDEPTTGLHTADVHKLIEVLQRLVDAGNTVLVIEHNLDVIKTADYIIDLGPEGGDAGGRVIASGTPEEVTKCKKSHTGKYLKLVGIK